MSRQRKTVRLPIARPRTPRPVFVWSRGLNLSETFEGRELRARRTWAGRIGEEWSKARQREDVEWSAMLELGQRVGCREAQACSMVA